MTLVPHSSAFYCPNNLSVSLGLLSAVQRAGERSHVGAGVQVWMQAAPSAVSCLVVTKSSLTSSPLSSHWGKMDKKVTAGVSLGSSDQPPLCTGG